MKAIKYVLAGVLMMGLSGSAFAQDVPYQEALKPIAKVLKANPNDPKAGKDLIKDYLKEYKKNEEAIVDLGTVYLQLHQFDKATELANRVINNKKMKKSNAYVLMGDIEALKDSVGNAGAAAAQYQTAISIDPMNVTAYERYARVYRHVNSDVAVGKLEELRKVKPDYPVEVRAAEILLNDQKYAEAAKWFEKAPKNQLDENAYYSYIISEMNSGNIRKSLEVTHEGLQKFSGSEYLSRLGMMAAVMLKDYKGALTFAKDVLKGKEKMTYNDYYYYGQALAGDGQYQEAINCFNKSLELKPDYVENYTKLADAYKGLGNGDKALEYQRMYLDKGSNITTADWSNLADIYVTMGEQADSTDHAKATGYYDQAIGVYEQMTEKFPSLKDWCWASETRITFGKMKNLDKTKALYEKIAQFEEAKPEKDATTKAYLEGAYYFLGYYYASKNDVATAKSYYEKVLEVNPDNAEAKKYIDAVNKAK